jgi:hypothetical protein
MFNCRCDPIVIVEFRIKLHFLKAAVLASVAH